MKPVVAILFIISMLMSINVSMADNKKSATQGGKEAFYADRKIRGKQKNVLSMNFSKIDAPESVESFFKAAKHLSPVSQGWTGTCWSFGGNSFIEAELIRMNGMSPRLSQMYSVYWEYVEKFRQWLATQGESKVPEGSQADAVLLRMNKYGMVPFKVYTGLQKGETMHKHGEMKKKLRALQQQVEENNDSHETKVLSKVRKILDEHLGVIPETFDFNGKQVTPKQYMREIAKFKPEDYVSFMSTLSSPFYVKGEHKVGDNWWHGKHYYNLPLDEWYETFKSAIKQGYTASICGDTSEPGDGTEEDISVIPEYDIPIQYINQSSRELRFYNGTTTDDHCIHVIGYQQKGEHDWFLIKDSGSKAYDGKFPGYFFYRGEYVRLKVLTFTVHKDAVKNIMKKLK